MANKKEIKRITLESLVAKKIEREKNEVKFKEIVVPSYGEAFLFEKPLEDDILDTFDTIGQDNDIRKVDEAYKILIYNTCPLLKNKETQEALGKVVPEEIVSAVFTLSERLEIGSQLVEFSGMSGIDDKVKN